MTTHRDNETFILLVKSLLIKSLILQERMPGRRRKSVARMREPWKTARKFLGLSRSFSSLKNWSCASHENSFFPVPLCTQAARGDAAHHTGECSCCIALPDKLGEDAGRRSRPALPGVQAQCLQPLGDDQERCRALNRQERRPPVRSVLSPCRRDHPYQGLPKGLRALIDRVSRIAGAVLSAMMAVTPVFAQSPAGSSPSNQAESKEKQLGMDVTVVDPTNAVIANAKVSLCRCKDRDTNDIGTDPRGDCRV